MTPVPGTLYADAGPGGDVRTDATTTRRWTASAPGLVPSAYAADGTVEAIELPGPGWVLGVQWHPEMGEDTRVMAGPGASAGPALEDWARISSPSGA